MQTYFDFLGVQILMRTLKIRDKITEQWRGYTYRNVYSSATKSHRELKLVTNNCYDNHKI